MKQTHSLWKPLYHESSNKIRLHRFILNWLPDSLKDRIGMLRRYQFCGNKGEGNPIVVVVDGSTFHGGLTDRWKGIISLYAYSKAIGRDFKIHYVYPFDLSDFQVPSQYDWMISPEHVSKNFFSALMLRLTGKTTLELLQNLPIDKQIHVYSNRDFIDVVNGTFATHYTWHGLFNELFKPSPLLQQAIDVHSVNMANGYIAVAFRMQNLLGDYPEYEYQATDSKRQEEIIELCMSFLRQLHEKCGKRILVTSDSCKMTEIATSLPYVWTNPGKSVHVDKMTSAPDEYYLKSFVDFYLLARAQKVYSVTTKEMYVSDFPRYAALTGNIPFERVFL